MTCTHTSYRTEQAHEWTYFDEKVQQVCGEVMNITVFLLGKEVSTITFGFARAHRGLVSRTKQLQNSVRSLRNGWQ